MEKEYSDILAAARAYQQAECFIFDMDGLIFDTERIFMEQLAVAMAEKGYRLTREVYCRSLGMAGKALEELMKGVYGEQYPFREMGQRARNMVNTIADTVGLPLKPMIPELLDWLKEQKICCAVASSSASATVKKYLENAEIDEYFSCIIGGEMVEKSKPEPDIFLMACDQCGVRPEQAVVLEDSENGIRAAYAAGIPGICVPDLKEPSEEVCRMTSAIVRTNQLTH